MHEGERDADLEDLAAARHEAGEDRIGGSNLCYNPRTDETLDMRDEGETLGVPRKARASPWLRVFGRKAIYIYIYIYRERERGREREREREKERRYREMHVNRVPRVV